MDYSLDAPQNAIIINFGPIFLAASWAIILVAVFFILKKLIRKFAESSNYYDHAIYLVRFPKDKPYEKEKENSLQELHEDISKGETIFASIGGLRAQRGITNWLLGRSDHFSFEIVANKKLISFYIVAPREMGRYIEQRVQAHYPEAVMEEVEDYNIFKPQSEVVAGYLKTNRDYIFPIKTYANFETDPVNAIINVMSKLDENEGMAIQYTVRSAIGTWHKRSSEIVSKAIRLNSVKEAISKGIISKTFSFLFDFLKAAKPPTQADKGLHENQKKLTAMEEEMLKAIEEKNSKAGLDVNLRVVVSAKNKGQGKIYLDNIVNVFSQYNNYEYGNSFKNKAICRNENKIIDDFIFRRFNEKASFLLNTEELTSMFHFSLRSTETPNVLWLTAKHAAAPPNIPGEGIIIGHNVYRGEVKEIKIKREDRRRHAYIIGKSGVGKSQLMASMAIQDILNGEGVCVIDPHGDLINDILERVPAERTEDVILFSPSDNERPLALNLMEFDERYPEQKSFVINEMIKIFDKLYDLKSTGGPIFEQYMRNSMLLVMSDPESGSTLMEIPKVLADPEFRHLKLDRCKDQTVVDFWRKEAEKAGGEAALANVVPYITSKLTSFISNDTMRPIIGQQKSSFNLRDVMDKQKILLVNLSKGQIGEMNSYLLGMILVGKILMAALSRTDVPQLQRKDFYLYIDEFQNFTTDSISSILSEARKYNLNLIIAHQYLGQLVKNNDTSIRDAVFGNVGTWMLFKIGSDDAEVMEKEMKPVFNQYDLLNIEKFTAYVKLLIDNTASRPFSMATPWPLPGVSRPEMAARIKALSRMKYGKSRELIEAEIMRRMKLANG